MLLDHAAMGRYLPTGGGSSSGHIVYYAGTTGSLMAVAFDASRLEVKGSPVPVVDSVEGMGNSPLGYLGFSDSGALAYISGAIAGVRKFTLVWVDRKGVEQPLPAPSREYFDPELSPDESDPLRLYLQDQGDLAVRSLFAAALTKSSPR